MIELLRNRRSVRQFTEQKISVDDMAILEEAVLRSPSSKGRDPWELIAVDDKELLNKLSESKAHGAAFAKNAPLVYVVLGDNEVSDMCIEDCSIAAATLHYTAESLGLGSCWIQLRERERSDGTNSEAYVRELLNIPERYLVLAMVAVGYPSTKQNGHPAESLNKSKIHRNTY
jgi:nitroreductase